MTPWEIRNKIEEIRSYISTPYFHPSQAKNLYGEMERLERLLKEMEDDQQTEDKRKEDKKT